MKINSETGIKTMTAIAVSALAEEQRGYPGCQQLLRFQAKIVDGWAAARCALELHVRQCQCSSLHLLSQSLLC